MQMVIRAIVDADDKKEALDKAEEVFERLVEEQVFDCYTTFAEERTKISEKDRWGELPAVTKATSSEGKKLIGQGWQYTKNEFMENIQDLRKRLEVFTDDELFEELDVGEKAKKADLIPSFFRYRAHLLGQHSGSSIWLYDENGYGIRGGEHLNAALTKCNDGKKVWVVPADVYY